MKDGCAAMYHTLIKITQKRALRLGLNSYRLHQILETIFETSDKTRFLYADKGYICCNRVILVQSRHRPRKRLFAGTMDTIMLPDDYLQKREYDYEIIVNPSYRENASGKIIAITGKDEIAAWFSTKAQTLGFEAKSVHVEKVMTDRFPRQGTLTTICKAHLRGILRVVDEAAFGKAVQNGIGRGKAFGCGLLQLAFGRRDS